jgi:hypothetical protein
LGRRKYLLIEPFPVFIALWGLWLGWGRLRCWCGIRCRFLRVRGLGNLAFGFGRYLRLRRLDNLLLLRFNNFFGNLRLEWRSLYGRNFRRRDFTYEQLKPVLVTGQKCLLRRSAASALALLVVRERGVYVKCGKQVVKERLVVFKFLRLD